MVLAQAGTSDIEVLGLHIVVNPNANKSRLMIAARNQTTHKSDHHEDQQCNR